MPQQSTFLVFGATGQTGRHFVSLALQDGHKVRAVARTPAKLTLQSPHLEVHQASITQISNLDQLLQGVDFVISMLGDVQLQKTTKINTAFVQQLVPAMRRQGVKRFLYQAGGLTRPYHQPLPPILWLLRKTMARGFNGQHLDNEAVVEYLTEQASDLEWMVHRAGIYGNGPSKGILHRSQTKFSIATFGDCAAYSYRLIQDPTAIHTCDLSHYSTT